MKDQKYFERIISGIGCVESDEEFQKLLGDGWKIVIAIPVQRGQSCHTYTSSIHYVLEREVER